MNNLTTRKIVLGLLMALVLACSACRALRTRFRDAVTEDLNYIEYPTIGSERALASRKVSDPTVDDNEIRDP